MPKERAPRILLGLSKSLFTGRLTTGAIARTELEPPHADRKKNLFTGPSSLPTRFKF